MAQIVSWSADNVKFAEGPFVVSQIGPNYARVEVELKGHICPVLPDISITIFIRLCAPPDLVELGAVDLVSKLVDWLNEQVRDGQIELDGKAWIAPVALMANILER